MANLQSQSTKQIQEDFTNFTINNTTIVAEESSQKCNALNVVNIVSCPPIKGVNYTDVKNLHVTQAAFNNCKLYSKNQLSDTTTVKTNIKALLKQFANQKNKNTQGWLATGFSAQVQGMTSKEEVENKITENIYTNVSQICSQVNNALNETSISICGNFGNIDINQNAANTSMASCVNQAVVNFFSSNTDAVTFSQKASQYQESTQSGIFSIFGIIIAVIVVLVLLGFMGNKSSKKNQQSNDPISLQTMSSTTGVAKK